MSVAFSTAIIPQPMQVGAGSAETGKKHQQSEQDIFSCSDGYYSRQVFSSLLRVNNILPPYYHNYFCCAASGLAGNTGIPTL